MSKILKITKLFSSEFILIVLRLITVIFIAREFNLDIVADYTTAMTWSSILSLMTIFGGYNLIQKNGSTNEHYKTIKISVINSLILTFILSILVSYIFFSKNFIFVLLILLSETLFLSLRTITKSILFLDNNLKTLTSSNNYICIVYSLSLISLFFLDRDKIYIAYFVLTYNTISLFLSSNEILRNIKGVKLNRGDFLTYYKDSYTFFISSSLKNLYQQIDKVLVNIFFSPTISGIYNLCSRFSTSAMLPTNLYIQSIETKFYHFNINGNDVYDFFINSKKKLLIYSSILSFLSILPAYVIFLVVHSPEKSIELYLLFIPLMISQTVMYLYLSLLNGQGFIQLRISTLSLLNLLLPVGFYFIQTIYFIPLFITCINLISISYIALNLEKKANERS